MDLQALRNIGYGVYIVCSRKGDKLNGQVVNTLFQVTSDPPTVGISINKKNLTHEFIQDSRVFTASVLSQETPLPFIGQFGFKSGRDTDKLVGVSYKMGVTGAPIVQDNAVSYFEAKIIQELSVGTHTIFIGEVVNAEIVSDKKCMTYEYYHQVKKGTTPRNAPTFVPPQAKIDRPKASRYRCQVCRYIYDPEKGDPKADIAPGTPFESLPDGWSCPVCGVSKSEFDKVD